MSHRGRRSKKPTGWEEAGGYMRAKIAKLEKQFDEQSMSSNLFHGVCIFVNGYTNPPASKLRDLITQHGGLYRAYYSRASVTHVIASRLAASKVSKLTNEKLVSADWITESIRAQKLLPWQKYQLYPQHTGGVGQQRLQIVPALGEWPADSADQGTSTPLTDDATDKPTTNEPFSDFVAGDSSSGLDRSEQEQKCPHSHRTQQMRLEACLSPKKPTPSTSEESNKKPPTLVSLKQLLKSSSVTHVSERPSDQTAPNKVSESSAAIQTVTAPSSEFRQSAASTEKTNTDQQLATFYARSRLHHLSSWASELRDLVNKYRDNPAHVLDLRKQWIDLIRDKLNNGIDPTSIIRLEARLPRSVGCEPKDEPKLHVLFHIDMDCFFVSVSLRNRPELRDKPVAITHAGTFSGDGQPHSTCRSGTHSMSEIASCSYAARKFGLKNGMLLGNARQLCPDLVTLPYDFDAYKEVSEQLYDTVARFTLNIEAVSCDELYADCTELLDLDLIAPEHSSNSGRPRLIEGQWCMQKNLIDPLALGSHIRCLVEQRTCGCTASVGFGTTRLLARLATKKAKPNGQTFFRGHSTTTENPLLLGASKWRWYDLDSDAPSTPESKSCCELSGEAEHWLRNLPLLDLPGVGYSVASTLKKVYGTTKCGELMDKVKQWQLTSLLGEKTGNRIYWLCRGRDTTDTLHTERQSKSVSACMNYGIRLQTNEELESLVRSLCRELVSRMASTIASVNTSTAECDGGRRGVVGRCLTVRLFIRAPEAPVKTMKFMGHGICNTPSRAVRLPEPTADVDILFRFAIGTVRHLCPHPKELRGLGLQMTKLSPAGASSTLQKIRNNGNPTTLVEPIKSATSSNLVPRKDEQNTSFSPLLSPVKRTATDAQTSRALEGNALKRRRLSSGPSCSEDSTTQSEEQSLRSSETPSSTVVNSVQITQQPKLSDNENCDVVTGSFNEDVENEALEGKSTSRVAMLCSRNAFPDGSITDACMHMPASDLGSATSIPQSSLKNSEQNIRSTPLSSSSEHVTGDTKGVSQTSNLSEKVRHKRRRLSLRPRSPTHSETRSEEQSLRSSQVSVSSCVRTVQEPQVADSVGYDAVGRLVDADAKSDTLGDKPIRGPDLPVTPDKVVGQVQCIQTSTPLARGPSSSALHVPTNAGLCTRKPVCSSHGNAQQSRSPKKCVSRVKLPMVHPADTKVSSPGPLTQANENPGELFVGKSIEQLRHIFANWITSESSPLFEDVCILADYLVEQVPFDLERFPIWLWREQRVEGCL
ncbi:unnamed protein product [Calicophoron daubneyi]|uniref:DNA repair protein REV1 n=1 Tax=Calicophoron daubneyi TaxID=300641 RepID=A0AAV2T5W6_CALDB